MLTEFKDTCMITGNVKTSTRSQKHVIYVNMGEAGVTVLTLNMFSFVSQLYSQLSDWAMNAKKFVPQINQLNHATGSI